MRRHLVVKLQMATDCIHLKMKIIKKKKRLGTDFKFFSIKEFIVQVMLTIQSTENWVLIHPIPAELADSPSGARAWRRNAWTETEKVDYMEFDHWDVLMKSCVFSTALFVFIVSLEGMIYLLVSTFQSALGYWVLLL